MRTITRRSDCPISYSVLIDLIVWGSKYNPDGGPEDILKKVASSKPKAIRPWGVDGSEKMANL